MADVKAVLQFALRLCTAALAVLCREHLSLACWFIHELRQGVRHGGWFTIGLAGFIGSCRLGMVADPDLLEFFTSSTTVL